MSSDPFGSAMGDMGADAPLFRELQRVLSSSSGPVNWELARQVGIATAAGAPGDVAPTDAERAQLVDAVRMAELSVADLTALPMPSDLVDVKAVRPAQWVEANVRGLRELLDPVASRLAAAMDGLTEGEDTGDAGAMEALGAMGPQAEMFKQLMGAFAPLLMGAQVGTVLGSLAQRVFGQYDLAVPRQDPGLLFVVPNIAAFERDWSLSPQEFRASVAIHEVAHRFEFAPAWVRPHFVGLIRDLAEHAEVDLPALQQRLQGIDPSDPEAMQSAMEGVGNIFGESHDSEQRLRISRLQAFIATAEGYADHVTRTVGSRLLPSFERIEEALKRHREGRGSEGALERLLGVAVTPEQYGLGEEFCRLVAEASDEPTLARLWGSASSMPSMPELEEPSLWLSRTI
jgi:putative hydrolase